MSDPNISTSWQTKCNTCYEFTFAPNDQCQFAPNTSKLLPRYIQWRESMENLIKLLPADIDYYLVPELSEPQSSHKSRYPRWHLHGIIKFRNQTARIDFLSEWWPKASRYGIIQMNTFRPDYWPTYITKDQDIMRKYSNTLKKKYSFSTKGLKDIISNDL